MTSPDPQKLFWKIAEELYSDSSVEEGSMMGLKCLRVDGAFFASLDRKTQALIVKLPQDRIQSLLSNAVGEPFAPAGRVFKEWIQIPKPDARRWRKLMNEAKVFVAS